MTKIQDIKIPGNNGIDYGFGVYKRDQPFNDVGAVYVMMRVNAQKFWEYGYVGESGTLGTRHANHERAPDFDRWGATHIAVHVVGSESIRKTIEETLVKKWAPPLNKTAHG